MIKVGHVAITVRDLESSLAFYRDVLGVSYVRKRERGTRQDVDLTDGTVNIRLSTSNGRDAARAALGSVGVGHIGFLVDDFDYVYKRLVEAKVEIVRDEHPHFVKFLDPEGQIVDIASVARGW